MDTRINELLSQFPFKGELKNLQPVNEGLINTTYLAQFSDKEYIVQKINTNVFKNPDELMSNIFSVTEYLTDMLVSNGESPERQTLHFLRTKDGSPYFEASDGSCWRSYEYIDKCYTLNGKCSDDEIYEAAKGFGNFQYCLRDYNGESLFETIKDFHFTPQRYDNLCRSIEKDAVGRAEYVKDEIDFLLSLKEETSVVSDLLSKGELPLRVTHNDTKINNVLFDSASKKAICVIDLDTIMPGSSLYDFGDGVRTSAATANEDIADYSKMGIDLDIYSAYVSGYLDGTKGSLTAKEIELLPFSVKLMTMEVAMRFLSDYLDGDVYFKISHPEHNLERTRAQIQLVKDIEAKMEKMNKITADAAGRFAK